MKEVHLEIHPFPSEIHCPNAKNQYPIYIKGWGWEIFSLETEPLEHGESYDMHAGELMDSLYDKFIKEEIRIIKCTIHLKVKENPHGFS